MHPLTLPRTAHRLAGLVWVALALTSTAGSGSAQEPTLPSLLSPASENAAASARSAPRVTPDLGQLRGSVSVRPAVLRALRGDIDARIEPMAGMTLAVRLRPRRQPGIGDVWTGEVLGDATGSVQLREARGAIAGRISTRGRVFFLVPEADGRSWVLEADSTPRLPDLVLDRPARLVGRPRTLGDAGMRGDPDAATADRSTFDLLVVVDRAALAQSPFGPPFVIDLVETGVVDLNTALAESGVAARVRLMKIKRASYPPDGTDQAYMEQTLEDLTGNGDGLLDRAHRWRQRFGADLVAFIGRRNTESCGMGWLSGERNGVQPEDAATAFSVTGWFCLTRDVLPHEIGHNLGLQHSHDDPISQTRGAYDASFGYDIDNEFHTIMSYGCPVLICPGVLRFSNPDVAIDGLPTGVASGPEVAANAWGLELDRETIAAFRPCRRRCGAKG